MSEQRNETSQNKPCSLGTICQNTIVINLIKQNGQYVKSKVDEQCAANRHKRRRSTHGQTHFTRTVSAWKEEMNLKISSDLKQFILPEALKNVLSSTCTIIIDDLFKWILQTWYNFPITSDINLHIFHFDRLFWRSNGAIHERKTFISHLCYILENTDDVLNCVKKRYSRTYASILKLIIIHFEMKIHENFSINSFHVSSLVNGHRQ